MKRFSQSRGTLGRNKTAPGKGVERKLVMNTPTRVTRTILIWFFIGSVILTACGGGGSTATAGASPAATKGSVLKGRILFGRYNQAVDSFLSAACGGNQNLISIARADGSDLRQVTHTSADVEFPDWGTHSE